MLKRYLPYLSLAMLAFAAGVGFLHWHLAAVVLVACIMGASLAIPRGGVVVAAIVSCPLVLLALVVSTTTWHGGPFDIFGRLFGDGAVALPVGLLVGGATVCSLVPYAAARWSRCGLPVALLVWAGGLLVTVGAVEFAVSSLIKHYETAFLSAGDAAKIPAGHYAMWLSVNGVTENVLHFSYTGHVDLADCLGLPQYTDKFSISANERKTLETFTYEPLPDSLRKWFSGSGQLESGLVCSAAVNEAADQTVEVNRTCHYPDGKQVLVHAHPELGQSFDVELPVIHMLSTPFLVPARNSFLTIVAPRGCIADTFPRFETIRTQRVRETATLSVGYPRDGFSLADATHITQQPGFVHVDLLRTALQGIVAGTLVRGLNTPVGMAILFVTTVLAFRVTLQFACGAILGGRSLSSITMVIWTKVIAAWRFARKWYSRQSRLIRWSLIVVLILVSAPFLLLELLDWIFLASFYIQDIPLYLLEGVILLALDPSYWIAGILFLTVLSLVEIIAFVVRRGYRYRHREKAAG